MGGALGLQEEELSHSDLSAHSFCVHWKTRFLSSEHQLKSKHPSFPASLERSKTGLKVNPKRGVVTPGRTAEPEDLKQLLSFSVLTDGSESRSDLDFNRVY
ncbi:hypothetical protein FQA47_005580 [Oryzias melastigma]|uniref:Uncharacterized protein n=1 Tax=Oryzias melastigma TaxID=30732 RepID=A0A834C959_ORYME|nr:hypothetical protein FQA47_005580 [Oryzias melastigma]